MKITWNPSPKLLTKILRIVELHEKSKLSYLQIARIYKPNYRGTLLSLRRYICAYVKWYREEYKGERI